MGRYGGYANRVEDCLTFRLKSLTENNNGYLTSYGHRRGVTTWSTNGTKTASISIEVSYTEYEAFIIFDYTFNGEPKRYKVNLIHRVSNLGKGKIWYFVCPSTGKVCRKLHLISGYFLHRTADSSLMYSKQIESKKNRYLLKVFDKAFLPDIVYEERYKKYFKTHYNGKLTKKYVKLQTKINIAESYPPDTMQLLLMN